MFTKPIRFRAAFKFQLAEWYWIETPILGYQRGNEYVSITPGGMLNIAAGYAWDGASGPIQQTPDVIRGSLVHDALYQLMRECDLPPTWRPTADEMLRAICLEDGMPHWLAEGVYLAVRSWGGAFVDPKSTRPVLTAPVAVHYPSAGEQVAP